MAEQKIINQILKDVDDIYIELQKHKMLHKFARYVKKNTEGIAAVESIMSLLAEARYRTYVMPKTVSKMQHIVRCWDNFRGMYYRPDSKTYFTGKGKPKAEVVAEYNKKLEQEWESRLDCEAR